jgi:AraC-like DNA-binding protein
VELVQLGAREAVRADQGAARPQYPQHLREHAAGEPVGRVTARVGYQNASAFVAAFRRETGVTPGEYFGR